MTHNAQSHLVLSMDDELGSYRHAYIETDLELLKRQKRLQNVEDIARRQRDAQFPPSVDAYLKIGNKDVQVKCAILNYMSNASFKRHIIENMYDCWCRGY